jgi:hypothetical protein
MVTTSSRLARSVDGLVEGVQVFDEAVQVVEGLLAHSDGVLESHLGRHVTAKPDPHLVGGRGHRIVFG